MLETEENKIIHYTPSQLAEIRKPVESVLRVFGNWAALLILLSIFHTSQNLGLKVLSFFLIGVEQHALSMWLHEGAHWLIFKNKKINDYFTSFFLAAPLYVNLKDYRRRHFSHHQHLGMDKDTKVIIFTDISGFNFIKFTLSCFCGLRFILMVKSYLSEVTQKDSSKEKKIHSLILLSVHVLAVFLFAEFSRIQNYFFFWMLPFMTVFQWVAGLRAIIEHHPPTNKIVHPYTAQISSNWLERFFFARAGFDYHWSHHKHQWVPWFLLPGLKPTEKDKIEEDSYFRRLGSLIRGGSNG